MKLLLDDMYSPEIARQLRERGHDVVAVGERSELVPRSDRELFELMAQEQRAIVTNNVPDYIALFTQASAAGGEHYGLLLTDERSMPCRREAIDVFVQVIDGYLRSHRDDAALGNQLGWLP